ncbi:hypothetical protein [Lacipirellula sp.]|uniref:hypothetical protein n=1 Tax=Lacipirellula sp. TaxID=2691419 RepID=UPI003D0CB459
MWLRIWFAHLLLAAGFAPVGGTTASGAEAGSPAYRIVVRSRESQATPVKSKTSQTGGGSIVIDQPSADTVVIHMGGSAAAGSTFHCSTAAINFALNQELEITPTREGLRPPRIGMMGRLIGTLTVTNAEKWQHAQGRANQGPASATLWSGENALLSVDVPASGVACGQKLAINNQCGPCEAAAAAGCYRLTANFDVSANQGKGVWHRQYAVADFDPAPQLDPFWADGLKTFRAVPREEFGFTLVVRVVEDAAATVR